MIAYYLRLPSLYRRRSRRLFLHCHCQRNVSRQPRRRFLTKRVASALCRSKPKECAHCACGAKCRAAFIWSDLLRLCERTRQVLLSCSPCASPVQVNKLKDLSQCRCVVPGVIFASYCSSNASPWRPWVESGQLLQSCRAKRKSWESESWESESWRDEEKAGLLVAKGTNRGLYGCKRSSI